MQNVKRKDANRAFRGLAGSSLAQVDPKIARTRQHAKPLGSSPPEQIALEILVQAHRKRRRKS